MVIVMMMVARMAAKGDAHARVVLDDHAAMALALPIVTMMVVAMPVADVGALLDNDAVIRMGRRCERHGSDAERGEDEGTNDIHMIWLVRLVWLAAARVAKPVRSLTAYSQQFGPRVPPLAFSFTARSRDGSDLTHGCL